MVDIVSLLIQIVVAEIILAPVLWLIGRALVGKDKAKFTDALWIVLIGVVIGVIVGALLGTFVESTVGAVISAIIMIIVWLYLIKRFFDCGWIKALLIAIIAAVVYIIIFFILAFILLLLLGVVL